MSDNNDGMIEHNSDDSLVEILNNEKIATNIPFSVMARYELWIICKHNTTTNIQMNDDPTQCLESIINALMFVNRFNIKPCIMTVCSDECCESLDCTLYVHPRKKLSFMMWVCLSSATMLNDSINQLLSWSLVGGLSVSCCFSVCRR